MHEWAWRSSMRWMLPARGRCQLLAGVVRARRFSANYHVHAARCSAAAAADDDDDDGGGGAVTVSRRRYRARQLRRERPCMRVCWPSIYSSPAVRQLLALTFSLIYSAIKIIV